MPSGRPKHPVPRCHSALDAEFRGVAGGETVREFNFGNEVTDDLLGKFRAGKLLDHPEIMTQGRTLKELEENMRDAYTLMAL